jgi:hypothetical protein
MPILFFIGEAILESNQAMNLNKTARRSVYALCYKVKLCRQARKRIDDANCRNR